MKSILTDNMTVNTYKKEINLIARLIQSLQLIKNLSSLIEDIEVWQRSGVVSRNPALFVVGVCGFCKHCASFFNQLLPSL